MEVHMSRLMSAVAAMGCSVIFLIACNALAQQSVQSAGQPPRAPQKIQRPPLFFREDWKLDPKVPNPGPEQEHTVSQGDLTNPNLELKLYGDKIGPVVVFQPNDDITFLMTLLCTANCAVALRDKNNNVDLTGLAKMRWRTKQNGFHLVRPIVKLADGTWLVGDHATGYSTDWVDTEIAFVDVRWRNLDIENVVEARDGKWVDNPDLSKVEEIGFTDLMRGSGHGLGGGSRIDWLEVYGKPVPRGAGSANPAK
jgi:hypothetical protein